MKLASLALFLVISCVLAFIPPIAALAGETVKIAKSELLARRAIAELEAENRLRSDQLEESDRTGPRAQALLKPFGFQNAEWEALKARSATGG